MRGGELPVDGPAAIDHQDPPVLTVGDHQVAGEWSGRDRHGCGGRRTRHLGGVRTRRAAAGRRVRGLRVRWARRGRIVRRRTGLAGCVRQVERGGPRGPASDRSGEQRRSEGGHDKEGAEHDRAERATGQAGTRRGSTRHRSSVGHVWLLRRSRINVQVLTGIRERSPCREAAGLPRRAGSHDSR